MWGDGIENFAIIGGAVDGGHTIRTDKEVTGAGDKVIAIKNGRNLLFDGVTHNSGGHFVYLLNNCENVTIANDTIKRSRDGIDLMGCRNVAVHHCRFTGCGDDTLGIKSDWGMGKKITTENIYAWDCYFESGCNGVQFGSETAGDFHNINVWNIKIGLAMKAGIGITSNDGGIIDGVRFDHFEIHGAANPIFMLITNRLRTGEPDKKTGTIRNVRISNITVSDMKEGTKGPIHCVTISGRPESWLENIIFENVKLTFPGGEEAAEASIVPPYPRSYAPEAMNVRPASGFYIRNVRGIELHNVEVVFEKPDPKPPMVASDVDGLVLDRFIVDQKPPGVETVRLDHVSDLRVQDSPGVSVLLSENVVSTKR